MKHSRTLLLPILTALLFVLNSTNAVAQVSDDWQEYQHNNVFLMAPADWTMDTSGMMGSTFIFMSPLENETDSFRENLNLVVQDVSQYNLTLEDYVKLTESQLKNMITDLDMKKSGIAEANGLKYGYVEYTSTQGVYNLDMIQHFYIIDGIAYIVTATTQVGSIEIHRKNLRKMLSSVSIK